LVLMDGSGHIIFRLETSRKPGKWILAKYGSNKGSVRPSEKYVDLDFDGQFDLFIGDLSW
jgi:hypothetical protein